jgi:hypothetical protein
MVRSACSSTEKQGGRSAARHGAAQYSTARQQQGGAGVKRTATGCGKVQHRQEESEYCPGCSSHCRHILLAQCTAATGMLLTRHWAAETHARVLCITILRCASCLAHSVAHSQRSSAAQQCRVQCPGVGLRQAIAHDDSAVCAGAPSTVQCSSANGSSRGPRPN